MNIAMDEKTDIPVPVRFNPFKHHRNFILRILKESPVEVLINLLEPLCNNYIDIYTGEMTPAEIGYAAISVLKSGGVLQQEDFSGWVASKKGFRQIKLQDQSLWIVRESIEKERYIHIHPARTGPLTMRFKGSTLKTVCRLKADFSACSEDFSLQQVNRIRLQTGLSPVKKLEKNRGILHCYQVFFLSGAAE